MGKPKTITRVGNFKNKKMKTMNQKGILSLKKETVVKLCDKALLNVQGGATTLTYYCPITKPVTTILTDPFKD